MFKYRAYYWYEGVPENRPGGPWWYLDFNNLTEFTVWYEECKSMFHKVFLLKEKTEKPFPIHSLMSISPPGHAKEVKQKKVLDN